MRSIGTLVLTVVVATGCGGKGSAPEVPGDGPELPVGWQEAVESIEPSDLLRDVAALASDDVEGRLPGSRGDRMARSYLAERLEGMGYEPLFPGGDWEQPFEIVGVTSDPPERWTFRGDDGAEVSFRFGEEYMGSSGVQRESVAIRDAEVVFVGYGIEAPEQGWDDFKGEDVSGKVLLMLNDDPDWDPGLFAGERKLSYGRWTYKYESAARHGAAGAVIVHTTPSAGYSWQVVRSSGIGEQFELPAGGEPRTLFNGWLSEDASRRLVALAGHDLDELVASARSRDFHPVPLGVRTSLQLTTTLRRTRTANVAGVLRGSDPSVGEEAVVFSAHHDHFGVGEPDETGDDVYNGALDNGVAMAEALAVAQAFARLPEPPRRSVVVLFPGAEEHGLLGSRLFVRSGVIHPGRMVANINFELGNVWGRTRDVMVYGLGKSQLDDWLGRAAATQGRVIRAEQDVRAGWFYRSDQISFARAGVPAIWFKSGVDFIGREPGWGEARHAEWIERHYHRPSDEVRDGWVLDGLAEDARLAFLLGAAVAEADVPPTWYPGDEFEDQRRRALDELGPAARPSGPSSGSP